MYEESWASPASPHTGLGLQMVGATSCLMWMLGHEPWSSCLNGRASPSEPCLSTLFQLKKINYKLPCIYCLCAYVHTFAYMWQRSKDMLQSILYGQTESGYLNRPSARQQDLSVEISAFLCLGLLFFYLFWDQVSLYRSGWPGTQDLPRLASNAWLSCGWPWVPDPPFPTSKC